MRQSRTCIAVTASGSFMPQFGLPPNDGCRGAEPPPQTNVNAVVIMQIYAEAVSCENLGIEENQGPNDTP